MNSYLSNARMVQVGHHFQATNASLCGDLILGEGVSVWFSAVIRADVAAIRLARHVNVQDGAVLHCDSDKMLEIEEGVTIGHGAVVHGRRIGRGSLIGMKAVMLGDVIIGEECLIAAGAVLSPGLVVPDRHVVMGVPGKVVRPIREAELEHIRWNARHYVELAREHAEHPEKFYR